MISFGDREVILRKYTTYKGFLDMDSSLDCIDAYI